MIYVELKDDNRYKKRRPLNDIIIVKLSMQTSAQIKAMKRFNMMSDKIWSQEDLEVKQND